MGFTDLSLGYLLFQSLFQDKFVSPCMHLVVFRLLYLLNAHLSSCWSGVRFLVESCFLIPSFILILFTFEIDSLYMVSCS